MYKYLYVNGDSMTMGAELYVDSDPIEKKLQDIRDAAWPRYVADHFGVDWTNKAFGGGSNDRVLRTTIDWVMNYINEGKDPSELFIILGMSEITRSELLVNVDDHEVYYRFAKTTFDAVHAGLDIVAYPCVEDRDLSTQDLRSEVIYGNAISNFPEGTNKTNLTDYIYGFLNGTTHEHLVQKYMFTLHHLKMFFDKHNIGYLFFQSEFYDYHNQGALLGRNSLKSRISKKLYDIVVDERCVNSLNESMRSYSNKLNVPFGDGGHPLHEGHENWGKYLVQYIEKHNFWSSDV